MKRSPSPLLALGLTLALLLALAAGVAWLASAPAHAASELGSEPAPGPSPSAVLFIENVGQFDPGARFQVRGAAGSGLWLSGDALWLTLLEADPAPAQEPGTPGWEEASAQPPPSRAVNVRLSFVGANPNPDLVPFGRLEAKVSYFLGNDPGRWRAAVPVWSGVRYVDLYPGVDLELTSEGGRYVQRLVTRDGSDLSAVRLRIEGAEQVSVEGGSLRMTTAVGEMALPLLQVGRTALGDGPPPELHTAGDSFEIASPFATGGTATFTMAPADDPGDLVYGTFLGGSADDGLGGLALAQGEDIVAVTGATKSADFYTTTVGAFDPTHNGGVEDVYVVKLNPAGNGLDDLLCATFLGGSGSDTGSEIRIDPDGNTYVVGGTSSADFPTTTLAYDGSYNDGYDVFVAKLISDCTDLVYSTYLGGSGADWGHGIAVDDGGHAFVTGYTLSGDFPTTEGAYSRVYNASGLEDVFVTAFTPDGQGLAYSTYVGGYWPDFGYDIDVHNGDAFVVGRVEGAGFPTTPGAFDETYNHGGDDGFVLRLNGAGSDLVYSSYLGGSNYDRARSIAVDGAGNAYVVGSTWSADFPTTTLAYDSSPNALYDAFVTKLNAAGDALVYATFLGGSNRDEGIAIAVGADGRAIVSGKTLSGNFPTTEGAFDRSHDSVEDAFLVQIRPDGSDLDYATFLGGNRVDAGKAVAVDGAGKVYVGLNTTSDSFATTPDAFDPTRNGMQEALLLKLAVKASSTFSVRGRVEDQNGDPIPDVAVLFEMGGSTKTDASGTYPIPEVAVLVEMGGSTKTDASGTYTISGLLTGTYALIPRKSGYTFTPYRLTVTVPPDQQDQDFTGNANPPLVFVHGWGGLRDSCEPTNPDRYFELVDNDLAAHYHVEYAWLYTSPCYTPPLVDNVLNLREAIEAAKAATGHDKVILIAHSMGGLVSRAYVEGPNYAGDVEALFTFGSPHQGVPLGALKFLANVSTLGEYCEVIQPGACEFLPEGMRTFNQHYIARTADVTYHVISGNAFDSPRSNRAKVMDVLLPGGDDGAVQTSSGTGLSGPVDKWITDEVHGTDSGPWSYFIRDGFQSYSYSDCLEPVLVDARRSACGSLHSIQTSGATTATPTERTPFEHGRLQIGQATTRTVPLEGGPTLFAAHWHTGTVDVTLVGPGGQLIDPAYAASHPDRVTYEADATLAIYDFADASAGSWKLVLRMTSAPEDDIAYTTFAAFESAVALEGAMDRGWYAPGSTATISASLAGEPTGAIVSATILYADGVSETLPLTPQGSDQYQGTHIVRDAAGYAEARLVAVGTTASSAPFERGLNLAFQVSPESVALTGAYGETPLPRSPVSSLYEALVVSVGIDSAISGTVGLSADLVDADRNPVAHSLTIKGVVSGTGTLSLRFDGDEIYASERDGPYTLTNLLLTDHRGPTLAILEAEDVYTTAAYDYRRFGRINRIYLPLVVRDQ